MSVTKLQEKANHFKIKPLVQNNSIDILSINKTKLDGAINDSEVHIPGYEIVCRDKKKDKVLLLCEKHN